MTSASKTFSILPFLITYAVQKPSQVISVVSESMPHLKRGAMKDFIEIMSMTGIYRDHQWNRTDFRYKFTNGSYIEFFSADQPDRLRGARRDVLFINECNNVDFESYHQMAVRTKKFIYLDFNPSSEFWVHTELMHDKDADFIVLTYKDNEALDPSLVKEIEKAREKAETSEYWANWWRVYGLGQVGMMQGVIFKDFKIIDELPSDARLLGGGIDFGYSNDPTAAVLVYRYNGSYIVDEILYETGLTNPDIYYKLIDHLRVDWIADSAEPKSIEELRRFNMRVEPALKGPDSVLHGIQLLQSENIYVTKKSTNFIKEMRNYCWDKNKQGEQLAKPIDRYNHCFTGDTMIMTSKGEVPMYLIQEGDMVLTRKGFKKVIKKWNNGIKQVNKYLMQYDTFSIYLNCTKEHQIFANQWIAISQLESGMTTYHIKSSEARYIDYTQAKGTLAEGLKECTLMFGSIIMGLFRKATTFITSMKTLGITGLRTSNVSKHQNTLVNIQKKDLKITHNSPKNFTPKGLKWQRNGTNPRKVENGIQNTVEKVGLDGSINHITANGVEKNLNQENQEKLNFAITTARLLTLEKGEETLRMVYDLTIEDEHEYFANGVLVHNCIDAFRYWALNNLSTPSGIYSFGKT